MNQLPWKIYRGRLTFQEQSPGDVFAKVVLRKFAKFAAKCELRCLFLINIFISESVKLT